MKLKKGHLTVFHRKEQSVAKNDSFSPSAGKPVAVLKAWQESGLPLLVQKFAPLTADQISLAHDPEYVRSVLACERPNGFNNKNSAIAKSLPFTTGSFAAAAFHAFEKNEICASLTSGFHHAHYSKGEGYCTFNGLIIAAQMLKNSNTLKKGRIGILDMDEHFGDGTINIINHLKLNSIKHWTLGESNVSLTNADVFFANDFLALLEENFWDVDVLLYQAGADPWLHDPLGGRLTKEQLRYRDQLVFEFCVSKNIGCAFNLAGGYSSPFQHVLDIHTNTLIEAMIASGLADGSARDLCMLDDFMAGSR
jgi:acetoin utilization deacetylase AcuC-like enzyme